MEITLRPVTAQNRRDMLALRVAPGQDGFIESTAECLEEAAQDSAWRTLGVYREEMPVGFVMYGLFEENRLWLDRMLIDRRYQGQGYGEQALRLMLDRLHREYPDAATVILSVYGDNRAAIQLYERYGFSFTGDVDAKGELIMARANSGCVPTPR